MAVRAQLLDQECRRGVGERGWSRLGEFDGRGEPGDARRRQGRQRRLQQIVEGGEVVGRRRRRDACLGGNSSVSDRCEAAGSDDANRRVKNRLPAGFTAGTPPVG
jgi:hypothetical protein